MLSHAPVRLHRFAPHSVVIAPNTPLINRGDESLPNPLANSTASFIATLKGVISLNKISKMARRKIFLSTFDICSGGKAGANFLIRAHSILPKDLSPLFHLIENAIRAGDIASAEEYANRLLATGSLDKIEAVMNKAIHQDLLVPFSYELTGPLITRKIKEKAHMLDTLTHKPIR